ncbi:MAG: hypothetical protein FWF42_00135 [Streptococcaceae bacterium]|nr:hypothetical protein [Streptococcaceae bacterium]MCL2680886.1 hypothetical protein [Streptococcaceae bacterium]MCL2858082.1 hypothetical protein [Streptococcaceae bacterium]
MVQLTDPHEMVKKGQAHYGQKCPKCKVYILIPAHKGCMPPSKIINKAEIKASALIGGKV